MNNLIRKQYNYAIEICGDGTLRGERIPRFKVHGSEYNSLKTDGATYVNPFEMKKKNLF